MNTILAIPWAARRFRWPALIATLPVLALAVSLSAASEAGHKFGAPHAIAGAPTLSQAVVLDGRGTAHIVYPEGDALWYRSIPAGGNISAPRALVTAGMGIPDLALYDLAIDGNGLLHLLWRTSANGVSTLYYATQAGTGPMGTPRPIQQTSASNPWNLTGPLPAAQLRVESSGRAHVVWIEETANQEQLKHLIMTPGGFGLVDMIAGGTITETGPQVGLVSFGVDQAGTAHIVFGADGANEFIRSVDTAGHLGPALALGQENNDEVTGEIVQVLVARDGTTHALWLVLDNNEKGVILYSLVQPNGTLQIDRALLLNVQYFSRPPRAALDSKGRLHMLAMIGPATASAPLNTFKESLNYSVYTNGKRQSQRTVYDETGFLHDFFIGIGPGDNPTIVWSFDKSRTQAGDDVYAVRPGSDSKQNISREAPTADFVKALATNPAGGAVAIWTAFANSAAADYFVSTYGN